MLDDNTAVGEIDVIGNFARDADAFRIILGQVLAGLGDRCVHLRAAERLVVSPAAGIFTSLEGLGEGSPIEVGDLVGHIGEHEVRSPFAGTLQSFIAVDTERVTSRQPIAWLRTD